MAKILIAEDDLELSSVVQDWLANEGHLPEATANGKEALERLRHYKYDLVILDWDLPGMSGILVCQEYRQASGTTPILMLTGKNTIDERAEGLDSGCDDYLPKPFHLKELSARVRALLRRPSSLNQNVLKVGNLTMQPSSGKLLKNGVEVSLMPREFSLLEFLMRHPGQLFTAEAILDRVWKSDSDALPQTVRIHIMRLRKKLDDDGTDSMFRTVHRMGYKLEPSKDGKD